MECFLAIDQLFSRNCRRYTAIILALKGLVEGDLSALASNIQGMSDAECGEDASEENQEREYPPGISPCGDGGSDLNRFFEALADDRRRYTLLYLRQNETVSSQDLTEFLAGQEQIDPNSENFERLRVDLLHLHLPKLADYGLLSFDERTKTVSPESLPTAVEQILDLVTDLEKINDSDLANK